MDRAIDTKEEKIISYSTSIVVKKSMLRYSEMLPKSRDKVISLSFPSSFLLSLLLASHIDMSRTIPSFRWLLLGLCLLTWTLVPFAQADEHNHVVSGEILFLCVLIIRLDTITPTSPSRTHTHTLTPLSTKRTKTSSSGQTLSALTRIDRKHMNTTNYPTALVPRTTTITTRHSAKLFKACNSSTRESKFTFEVSGMAPSSRSHVSCYI